MISRLIYIYFTLQVKVVLALEIIVWNEEAAEVVAVAAATATILTAEVAVAAAVVAADMVGVATVQEYAVLFAEHRNAVIAACEAHDPVLPLAWLEDFHWIELCRASKRHQLLG